MIVADGRGRGGRGRAGRGPCGRGRGRPHARRIRGFLEPALLLLLHRGESHGYELADGLAGFGLTELAAFDMSSVYRALRAMEDQGFVTSEWDTNSSGPAKRLYSMTPAGDDYLSSWVEDIRITRCMLDLFVSDYEKHMKREHGSREPE